jgi:hypothetical protein
MSDNTPQNGTDNIATDELATLNGVATVADAQARLPKAQRFKPGYGVDGDFRDVSTTFPLPVIGPDGAVTGTITATDAVLGTHAGVGVPLTGTPTANSYVAYALRGGESGFTLRLSGTFGGGTVWMESSVDSTNGIDGAWTTNLVRQSGIDVTFLDNSLVSPGIFRGVAAGYSYLRVRMTGATTPSVTVALRASQSPSVTALVASLPPGGNNIGSVTISGANPVAPVGGNTIPQAPPASGGTGVITAAITAVVATTALVSAPGAGLSIYVTDIESSNSGSVGSLVALYEGSVNQKYPRFLAPSGGGGVSNLRTAWKLPANTALGYSNSVASTTVYLTVNYYVAP